jgi:hypothetical protein
LPEANLHLTLDVDLALQLNLTMWLALTLHLRRSRLDMVKMRPRWLLVFLRHLVPLQLCLLLRWLLRLWLGGIWSRGVEYPTPDVGTSSTAYAKRLSDHCTTDCEAYLLDGILLEEGGGLVEPAILAVCRGVS